MVIILMQKEFYQRGPTACGIDALSFLNWESGIISDAGSSIDHVISVVGWGNDASQGQYWIVCISWGEYWSELGYVRVAFRCSSSCESVSLVNLGRTV